MEVKRLQCPKCNHNLQKTIYMEKEILVCPECKGALVNQRDLNSLLEKLYLFLISKITFTGGIEKVPDKQVKIKCPSCQSLMDQHGYMGTDKAFIDVCSDCQIIFVDKYELGVMALLIGEYKEENKRIEVSHKYRTENLAAAVINSWILY